MSSYLLCATPRTGSTLLCGLLASTGVAGHPESYFRPADQQRWAGRFGMAANRDGSVDYGDFAAAALQWGSTSNGVFAARVMWGTIQPILHSLSPERGGRSDLDVLEEVFGGLRLVHLVRENVVAQAVSWARAEQTGHWQGDDDPVAEPVLDLGQIDRLLHTIIDHNRAWRTWFRAQATPALQVTYEELVRDPARTVRGILDHLAIQLPADWSPSAATSRQADELNAEWERRYRASRRGQTR